MLFNDMVADKLEFFFEVFTSEFPPYSKVAKYFLRPTRSETFQSYHIEALSNARIGAYYENWFFSYISQSK